MCIRDRNGIDYYRQDFNMGISPYWEANDEPGRTGMKEIRHVEGLYKFWDYLLDRFPRLMIDNCAAGGRRLDLETMSRSAPLWRTDYRYGEVNGYQCHTYGLKMCIRDSGTRLQRYDYFTGLHRNVSYSLRNTPVTIKNPARQKNDLFPKNFFRIGLHNRKSIRTFAVQKLF